MAIFKLRFNLREWGFNRCVERGRKRQRGSARVQHAPESPDGMTEEFAHVKRWLQWCRSKASGINAWV